MLIFMLQNTNSFSHHQCSYSSDVITQGQSKRTTTTILNTKRVHIERALQKLMINKCTLETLRVNYLIWAS